MQDANRDLSAVKAVIFDYGEVLCLAPTPQDLEESARVMGITPDLFRALWGRNRDLYDRGDLSPEVYWRSLAQDAGKVITGDQLQDLRRRDVEMWSRLNPAMLAWMEKLLASGIKTAVLSNMHVDMVQLVRERFRWIDRVSWKTLSAEVHLIKPDPAIFHHCLQGLGVKARQALFLDDRSVNVEAARALGIHGIQFTSTVELRDKLEAAKFPTLPLALQM